MTRIPTMCLSMENPQKLKWEEKLYMGHIFPFLLPS